MKHRRKIAYGGVAIMFLFFIGNSFLFDTHEEISALVVTKYFLSGNEIRFTTDGKTGLESSDDSLVDVEIQSSGVFLQGNNPDSQNRTANVFQGGDLISLKGTITAANFVRYRVAIEDSKGNLMQNPAVILRNGGSEKIYDGVLATWDTTGIPADHYTVHLIVTLTNGTVIGKSSSIIVDPTLHSGWPINLDLEDSGLAIINHLNSADIDMDGGEDLLIGYGDSVRIFNHNGYFVSGWPQTIDPENNGALIQQSPAVGDLDADGWPEVVASNNKNQVFIWDHNGELWEDWPKFIGRAAHLAIDDIDNNGEQDLIIVNLIGEIAVRNTLGGPLPGWPVNLGIEVLGAPAIGDLDGDGKKEIVILQNDSAANLYVYDYRGRRLNGWPKQTNNLGQGNYHAIDPALGDLDGDGDLEIVVGSSDGHVRAFHHDGQSVAGWPQFTRHAKANSVALGDLNGDGTVEVVAGNDTLNPTLEDERINENHLQAWFSNGRFLNGWPVQYDRLINEIAFGFGAPILANIDEDRFIEIIVSSDSTFRNSFALNAYNFNGSKAAGFPKPTFSIGASGNSTPVIADMDDDGFLELAWIDGRANLYLWDLSAPITSAPWPAFRNDSAHTGRQNPGFNLFERLTNISPSVVIDQPTDRSSIFIGSDMKVSAQASDDKSVVGVDFLIDGFYVGTDKNEPYGFGWDTTGQTAGEHALQARARDIDGNSTLSEIVNIVFK